MRITKNFRINLLVRISILSVCIALFSYLVLVSHHYLRSAYLLIFIILTLIELIWYIERTNRDFNAFLLGLLQADFTTTFNEKAKGKSFGHLYATFNKINRKFRAISAEKEIQHLYLATLVEHVNSGILSFSPNGKVHLMNNSLKQLLKKPHLFNIDALVSIDPDLYDLMKEIEPGENKLIKLTIDSQLYHLAIHATAFKLYDKAYKLLTIQDIKNELDANELDAWQKLIRVLTHEIMNSVTPITSLTATLYGMVKENEKGKPLDENTMNNLIEGLDVILNRSNGLQSFTEAYRNLSRIPQPKFSKVALSEIVERVIKLQKNQYPRIEFIFENLLRKSTHNVDPNLIEQVLINLTKNAIEALDKNETPKVKIKLSNDQKNSKLNIQVLDNGSGIPKDIQDNIFIPFFTTKNQGSGIGLALCKQIMRMHGGNLTVVSEEGEGSCFKMTL